MTKRLLALLFFLGMSPVYSDTQPAEVMIFGVFHFANPGLDVVRVDQVDVSTSPHQSYLAELAQRLCEFRPTAVLLEFQPSDDAEVLEEFKAYQRGEAELGSNEIYQLGFRVAQRCQVERIHGIDEREVGWNAGLLFTYLEQSAPDLQSAFNHEIARLQEAEATAHRHLGLRELLIRANDPAEDRVNKDLYLLTNAAGAGQSFEGADAAASWWHRNFRMYANIQRYASPGERLLVVVGQGHASILRDLLEIDRRLTSRDIQPYL